MVFKIKGKKESPVYEASFIIGESPSLGNYLQLVINGVPLVTLEEKTGDIFFVNQAMGDWKDELKELKDC